MPLRTYNINCCGVQEIYGFYAGVNKKQLADKIKTMNCGYVTATLTHQQVADFEELLLKGGFTKLSRFFNPNSQNTITMYGIKIKQKSPRMLKQLLLKPKRFDPLGKELPKEYKVIEYRDDDV